MIVTMRGGSESTWGVALPRWTGTPERWLASLYLSAGALGVFNSVVPGYPGFDIPGLLVVSAAAFVIGGALLFHGRRVARAWLHVLLGAGNALIAAAIHFTQGVPNAASMFYLWIALYAFYFFPRRAAAVHMVLVGVSYAAAIALRPPPFSPVPHWATTVLTMTVAGVFVGVLKSRLDASMADLTQLADTDPLTGLANRRGWGARAHVEMHRAERLEQSLAVAVIDLDDFKPFNDEHGHGAGDRLLAECAAAWRGALRDMDFVARLGGDEFAVLLPGCGTGAAVGLAERLQAVVPLAAGCSVGIAHWEPGETVEQTVARADAALYAAKRAGRGGLVVAAGERLRPRASSAQRRF